MNPKINPKLDTKINAKINTKIKTKINPKINTCAGIVLYNPDPLRLKENIAAVTSQVDKIIFVDNGTSADKIIFVDNGTGADKIILADNRAGENELYNDPKKYIWIKNKKNIGVAAALNQIIKKADELCYEWVLTLDQDSICSKNLVETLLTCGANYPDAGIIAPYIIDINEMAVEEYLKLRLKLKEFEIIKICITSGSLTSVKAYKSISGFNEELFIDQVDHDFCLRLHRANWHIIKANRAWLLHEVGKSKAVYVAFCLGKLTGIEWFLRPKRISNHPPVRVYYQTRNLIYILRKYGREYTGLFNKSPIGYWINYCEGMCLRILAEEEKIKKIFAFIKGSWHGVLMKMVR